MNLYHIFMMAAALGTATPSLANTPPTNIASTATANFNAMAQRCGNGFHPNTLQAIARVESGFNPYAIGVVHGSLKRQPRTLAEAVSTAKMLHAQGRNFSMGLMQINRYNLKHYGLNYETVFDVCNNISAGAKILYACYKRAGGKTQEHLHKAFSCYYSGNFKTGFRADFKGQPPYVTKILNAAAANTGNARIRHGSTVLAASRQQATTPIPAVGQITEKMQAAAHTNPIPAVRQPENDAPPLTNQTVALNPAPKRQAWDIFQEF